MSSSDMEQERRDLHLKTLEGRPLHDVLSLRQSCIHAHLMPTRSVQGCIYSESENVGLASFSLSWPAPKNVRSVITTRQGGVSLPPYKGFNLGDHVGDDLNCVLQNRKLLLEQAGLKSWHWLNQVHGTEVIEATPEGLLNKATADGVYTRSAEQVCAVLTADCLPVLFCDEAGTQVAAVHAGWRGLAAGILKNAVDKFDVPSSQIMAYLGPAIGADNFEVGRDVLDAFLLSLGSEVGCYFKPTPSKAGYYLADLYSLAKLALRQAGVTQVSGGDYCTYADEERFFSYRRDGVTGRMVSAIWLV